MAFAIWFPEFAFITYPLRFIYETHLKRTSKGRNREDLLQTMIDAKPTGENVSSAKKFTAIDDDEIVGNVYVFLEAGFETTNTTLAYLAHILVNLTKHLI